MIIEEKEEKVNREKSAKEVLFAKFIWKIFDSWIK